MDLRKHPFTKTWWMKGVAPAARFLAESDLLEIAEEHPALIVMVAELMLLRKGLKEEYDVFFRHIEKLRHIEKHRKQVGDQVMRLLDMAFAVAKFMKDGLTIEQIEEHIQVCKNPKCPYKAVVKTADKVASEALGLSKR